MRVFARHVQRCRIQYGTSAPKRVTQFFAVMNIIWIALASKEYALVNQTINWHDHKRQVAVFIFTSYHSKILLLLALPIFHTHTSSYNSQYAVKKHFVSVTNFQMQAKVFTFFIDQAAEFRSRNCQQPPQSNLHPADLSHSYTKKIRACSFCQVADAS